MGMASRRRRSFTWSMLRRYKKALVSMLPSTTQRESMPLSSPTRQRPAALTLSFDLARPSGLNHIVTATCSCLDSFFCRTECFCCCEWGISQPSLQLRYFKLAQCAVLGSAVCCPLDRTVLSQGTHCAVQSL